MVRNPNHHLFKRGDTWYLQAVVSGIRVRRALAKNLKEARSLRDQIIKELRWGHLDSPKMEKLLFGELATRWFKLEEMRLRPSTLRDYRSIMNCHVLPHFGNWFIEKIRPVDVEEFMATRGCGAKRVNNILVPMRSVFRMARKNGFVQRNIMLDVGNLPVDKPHINPLSMREVAAFLSAVNPHYRNYFTTAFFTGLRQGEQVALKWKAIDWERKKISIIESRVRGIEGRPKTKGSRRDVDILPVVDDALKEQRRETGLKSPYVFLNTDENPIDGETLRKWTWTPALEKAGLENRSMYHTRHTFATLMLSAGENVGWVQQMMGHTSLRMIQERYYRYIPNLTHLDGSAFSAKFQKELEQVTPKLPQKEKRESTRKVIPFNRYKK